MSYSNLLNLESLMRFRLHKPDAASNDYGGGSPDESTSSQDEGAILDQCNGAISSSGPRKRKSRMLESEAYYADEGGKDYETRISEEEYRSMLGEHVQKYRRVKLKNSTPLSTRVAAQVQKHGHEVKTGKFYNEPFISMKEELALLEMDISPEYKETEFDSAFLDIVDGVSYEIPQSYEKLTTSLKLPSISDLHVEEYYLNGTLDLPALATFVSSNRWSEAWNRGLGEPQPQYKSLQARLKALSASSSSQSFALQVCDIGLDPFVIPEGAAGRIPRWILSGSGTLELYYVKVREKGDTYEIIERSLPKKQIMEKDPSLIKEEELEKLGKIWVNIARRDISKHQKIFINFHRKKLSDAKRCSEICQKEVKWKVGRSLKLIKSASNRTRKLTRDMLIFWKRVDKEQAELRKIEERVAAEALKREEEAREAKRQRQRLNFLLSQTELYSHFMQNKSSQPSETLLIPDVEFKASEETSVPVEIKPVEEDPEEAELRRDALRAAQNAVFEQKKITSAFDSECLKLRQADEPTVPDDDPTISGSSNIDLLNPSTMPVTSSVQTPEMFKGTLKDYQLKGLQWLVNCYEQGLNGILADEMGLGKTIQAMAFLAHLAEEKNIWGPFLVVAPSSVLNNWSDEVSRFCPDLRTLPYWGELQARTILRKNIQPKRLYRRESGFHILITSYQLLVTDERYLRRVKWQYMVLDEAQAIKSSNSIRWKTLLSFNCRNRLLLTGTPIQNNMAELWALLHFIMPTLFDSHDQFNEWFSKGIESHAEHGGTLNEHQLNRLHAILKPFMLRRIKKDVIAEMTSKTEVMVHCKLSSRQQAFYQAIKNKISLAELFDGSRGHLSEKKIVNLMNIVIQLRKVCNHPELFERNEGTSYLYFGEIPNSPLPPPFGELEDIHYAGNWNPITYKVPKLVYQDIICSDEMSPVTRHGVRCGYFEKLFNIFSPENIFHSSVPHSKPPNEPCVRSGAFGFTRLINLSPGEASYVATCSLLERLLFSVLMWDKQFMDETLENFMDLEKDEIKDDRIEKGKVRAVSRMLLLPTKSNAPFRSLVVSQQDRLSSNIRLLRSTYSFIPRSRAPPINAHCPDRNFAYQMVEELHHPWVKKLFLGYACTSEFNGPKRPGSSHPLIQEIDLEPLVIQPALQLTYRIFGSSPPIRSFDPAKMLTDSGKLQTLDILLKRLRAENHRILLFAQMTKMLNILEDYMNYRKYRYLRLDGSSSIMDRSDMVRDFQHRNDIFVFLLSTRAGGLGINLTAADTVIFYESDWNPTLDLQAMDRAHRLGQTKEVTVYRLICKETVEEKILQRASQKNTVQQLVMTGGHVQGDLLKTEDVVSLLLDDAQLEQKLREIPLSAKDPQKKKRAAKGIRVDANGDVRLEDFDRPNVENETAEHDNGMAINKKRKSDSGMQTAMKPPSKPNADMLMDEYKPIPDEDHTNTSQRLKRRPESTRAT